MLESYKKEFSTFVSILIFTGLDLLSHSEGIKFKIETDEGVSILIFTGLDLLCS